MAEATEDPTRRIPVVRDSTFHRATADVGLVIDLGRDIEISFIQKGPAPKIHVREGEAPLFQEGYEMDPVVTEVARIRMAPPQAFSMAMQIVQSMIEEDRIKVEPFLEQLHRFVDEAKASQRLESEE